MSQELIDQINTLRRERNAIILAHNYQWGEVQDIADYVGDSLGLSRQAAETEADVIVFCGVHFMAETASILSQDKTILIPDENAGCPMANMVTTRELKAWKEQHPAAKVVTYVNSSAAVKALSDVCCTSANAVQVVEQFAEEEELLFVPDRNLGRWVEECTGRSMHLWNGFCPTHERFLADLVRRTREEHPQAQLVMHPEAPIDVLRMADHVASTTGILRYCAESEHSEFIVGTESNIIHRLRRENPGKTFHYASPIADCPNMRLITLEKVLWCLQDLAPEVRVDPEIAAQARRPIERMLEVRP